MLSVNFYRFKKKKNSTAQPSDNPTVMQCAIKSDCSIVNPVLEIAPGQGTFVFNYAYIPDFGRYYFVNDWKYSVGTWTVYLSVDVMASYKTAIGNHSAYVLRAADDSYGDIGEIVDTKYPITTGYSVPYQISKIYNVANATVVLGIVSYGGTLGGITYYAMSLNSSKLLFDWLMGKPQSGSVGSNSTFLDYLVAGWNVATTDVWNSIYDPMQYIKSAMYFPFDLVGTGNDKMYIGRFEIPADGVGESFKCKKLTTLYYTANRKQLLVQHPSSGNNTNIYLNAPPYLVYTLSCAPFPDLVLPGTIARYVAATTTNAKYNVDIDFYIDIPSGEGTMSAYLYSVVEQYRYQFLGRRRAQIGVPLAISSATKNVSGIINSIGETATATVSGNAFAVGANIGNAVTSAISPRISTQGTNGAVSSFVLDDWFLIGEIHDIAENNRAEFGAPLCKTVVLNTLSGYIQCAEGDIKISGTEQEIDAVNNFLTGGFFYE